MLFNGRFSLGGSLHHQKHPLEELEAVHGALVVRRILGSAAVERWPFASRGGLHAGHGYQARHQVGGLASVVANAHYAKVAPPHGIPPPKPRRLH